MARIEEDDIGEFIFGCLLFMIIGGFIITLVLSISSGSSNSKRIAEISSRSDSYIILTAGKYTNTYYTNRSTIEISEHGACISFTDNSTIKPVAACTQFTIKAN